MRSSALASSASPMRIPSPCAAAACVAIAAAAGAQAQQPSNRLESGRAIERAIRAGQVDTFRVALDSGEMVRVVLTQRGIDLVVRVLGPGGETRSEVDDTDDGPDTESKVVARRTGDHQILVKAVRAAATPGNYALSAAVVSREQVAALFAADRARRDATVAWLSANAVRLRTVAAGSGFDDMEPLRAIIGDARVVGLGEATHGAHEFFALKHRMLEFLVTKMGFTVFAMEGMMSEGFDINEYVATGRGDPGKALSALYYWNWNAEEILDLIQWMRRWNADPRHTRKLKFYGFDLNGPPRLVTAVRDYLRRVDPAEARQWSAIYANQSTFVSVARGRPPAPVQDSLLRSARAELERFDAHRAEYVGRSSVAQWEMTRALVRNLVRVLEPPVAGAPTREKVMAENIAWMLEREGPGAKAVLWAHNGHIAANCTIDIMMGCVARQAFGRDMVAIGFSFNRGRFNAVSSPPTIEARQRAFEVPPAVDSSLDGTFAQAGLRIAAVDLRRIPAGPVAEWFAQPRHALTAGVYFSNEWPRDGYAWDSGRFYDAMLFVDSTSESHLRPGGVWPLRAIQPAPANLTFEESTPGDGPTGWYPAPSIGAFGFVDPEYRTALSRESPSGGGRSVVVSRAPGRHYGMTNGGIEQIIDAAPYRGNWVRLKAMCREQVVGGDSRASLWVSLTPKVVQEMQIRLSGVQTISGRTWRSYELYVQVTENAATISYGLALAGDGKAWIDDVSLEVVPKPPQ